MINNQLSNSLPKAQSKDFSVINERASSIYRGSKALVGWVWNPWISINYLNKPMINGLESNKLQKKEEEEERGRRAKMGF